MKNITIKPYFQPNIPINAFANYTCNGGWLAWQPISLGDYNIPNPEKVKSVTIKWKYHAVDDYFAIQVHDIYTHSYDNLEIMENGFIGINKKVNWKGVNKINIKAGAVNTQTTRCYLYGAEVQVLINYDK
ncbi:hypothetical protein IO405_001292 [Campylobacter lari]|nr:hypothetical protein [Campylobacter lari]